jgi:hypothetical protein
MTDPSGYGRSLFQSGQWTLTPPLNELDELRFFSHFFKLNGGRYLKLVDWFHAGFVIAIIRACRPEGDM